MTEEQHKALRAAFPAEVVGKLPKPTRKENPKGKCAECGGWHGLPAVHLDYVGHAAVTDRLLQVDPTWTWEPMARNEQGFPLLDAQGGLWILLTICGVTRPGYGDATMGHGMKEVIGDALRNAAMRFGVALDLWSKEDLQASGDAHTPEQPSVEREPSPPAPEADEGAAGGTAASSHFPIPQGIQDQLAAEPAGQRVRNRGAAGRVQITFGKHALKTVSQVPHSYLEWLASDAFEAKGDKQVVVKQAALVYLKDAA